MTPRKEEPKRHCRHCAAKLVRKRVNDRLEDLGVFGRRLYCDRACMAAGQEKANPSRSAYLWRARKHVKSACEKCGATERLHVHHDDRNWRNNDPANLVTLCPSCHLLEHWKDGAHVAPRRHVLAAALYDLLAACERAEGLLPPEIAGEMRSARLALFSRPADTAEAEAA